MEAAVNRVVRFAAAFGAAAVVFVGVVVVLDKVMDALTPRLMIPFKIAGLSTGNAIGLAVAVAGSAWVYGMVAGRK